MFNQCIRESIAILIIKGIHIWIYLQFLPVGDQLQYVCFRINMNNMEMVMIADIIISKSICSIFITEKLNVIFIDEIH